MLRQLDVRDFAIIERAQLELGAGMTVLTGETGAGKSLLVDALLLLCGARGDAGWIRAGAERAELTAEFELATGAPAIERLQQLELDDAGVCRLRRVIRRDGTSRAFVNDRPASLATLRELGSLLLEIHGQHEHQALLERPGQLALLDAYGDLAKPSTAVALAADAVRQASSTLTELERNAGVGSDRSDWLRFQLDELERDALSPSDWQALEEEHRRLSHAGDLLDGCARLRSQFEDDADFAPLRALARAETELVRLAGLDPALSPAGETLRQGSLLVQDAARELARYADQLELDPARLATLDANIARVLALSRKHRATPATLFDHAQGLREELAAIEGQAERRADLESQVAQERVRWRSAAAALSDARRLAGQRLASAVTALMPELGMAGGSFEVTFEPAGAEAYGAKGAETCEFQVSANPGQPLRALRKVASGGELARISLALEVAALGSDAVATMVFDEVDTGIGGAVAEVVGRKLRALGDARQVLCVTHLAQVAAQGHQHVAVLKDTVGGAARVAVETLDSAARDAELARMLGGIEITAKTLAHARDMRRRAQ